MGKKILILGEAGERPWLDGRSSERLWRWFGVKSHAELSEFATLMNVFEFKDARVCTVPHMKHIVDEMEAADRVFLVGRVAQSMVFESYVNRWKVMWREGKYVGLPHPSGLNRQLNTVKDEDVMKLVKEALT